MAGISANLCNDNDLRAVEMLDQFLPGSRLAAAVTSDATTWTLNNVEKLPYAGSVTCESETAVYTAIDLQNNRLTVTRGTTKATHADDSVVRLANWDTYSAEATREIKQFLRQQGFDVDWYYDDKPKLVDTSELRTPAVMLALASIYRMLSSGDEAGGFWVKYQDYKKQYDAFMDGFRPRTVVLDKSAAVWVFDSQAEAWYDRSSLGSVEYGDPFDLFEHASDYILVGLDTTFTTANTLMAVCGSYGALSGEYWNGSAWTDAGITDNTSAFTNAGEQESISWGSLSGWAMVTLSNAGMTTGTPPDTRSRYWLRLSAASVTATGKAFLFAVETGTEARTPAAQPTLLIGS